MRLYPFTLVASTAVLARDTYSLEIIDFKMTEVDLQDSVRSSVSRYDGTPIKRLLRVQETTTGEERMRLPLTSRTTQSITKEVSKIYKKLFDDVDKLQHHPDFKQAVIASEQSIYQRFHLALNPHAPGSIKQLWVNLLSSEKQGMIHEHKLLAHIRAWKSLLQTKVIKKTKAKRAKWIKDGVLPIDVATRLVVRDNRMNNPFASLHLEALRTYIDEYNMKEGTTHTLLETLSGSFGGEANFAPVLSAASYGLIHGPQAQEMQMDLLRSWLDEDKTIDAVAEILMIRSKGKKALAFQNLDTLNKYIKLFSIEHPEEKTDLFTVLRKTFGDRMLALLIEEAKAVDKLAVTLEDNLFRRWKTSGIKPENLDSKIFAQATRRVRAADANTVKLIRAKFTRWFAKNR